MALAYFLTFTTYGTWLHGTAKGMGSVDMDHNAYGTPFVAPDPARLAAAREAMTQPPYLLDAPRRNVVRDAIVSLAAEKGWRLWAAHVRGNHVHVVITADRDPGRVMSDLKGRSSRDLNRLGFDTPARHRWTRHGSTLHLFDEAKTLRAVRYTLDEQGPRTAWFEAMRGGRWVVPIRRNRARSASRVNRYDMRRAKNGLIRAPLQKGAMKKWTILDSNQ